MQNGTIFEIREPSAYQLNEFYLYYELLRAFNNCLIIENFCEYYDENLEFAYVVDSICKLWSAPVDDMTLQELHEFIFEWALEFIENINKKSKQTSDRPQQEFMKIDAQPYILTLARLWQEGVPLSQVVESTKLLTQSEINEIVDVYNKLHKDPEQRFKEWSKEKALSDIKQNRMGSFSFGEEVDL